VKNRVSTVGGVGVRGLLIAAGAALAFTSTASAQSSWAAVVSDSWFNGARWAPAGVPNAAGTNVTLGMAGAYTVSMQNQSAFCGTLTLANTAATLNIFDNATLTVWGAAVSNSGLIQVSGPGAPGNTTRFNVGGPVSISGPGTLRLAGVGSGDNLSAYLHFAAAGNVLTNELGHTIAGKGRVYVNLVNNGLVSADGGAGTGLFLVDQPKTNNAIMQATGGGTLQANGITLTQGAGGVFQSSAGSVAQIVSSTVSGGTIDGAGVGGGVQYYGNSFLDGATLQNANAVMDNSTVNITPAGVINNGIWTVGAPGFPGNVTRIRPSAATATIGGTGTIRLQGVGSGNDLSAHLTYTSTSDVLTNAATHSIKGYGRIYTNLVNDGTVNADVSGKTLYLIDEPKANNGTMTASNGGILQFSGVTVTGNPTAQIISTDAASPVQFVNSTLTGGGFNTAGSGLFQYFGTSVLANLTVNGTHQITDNSVVSLTTNLVNNGSWLINSPTAAGNTTYMRAGAANVSISGTGSIRLQGVAAGNGDNLSSYLTYTTAANVLTLGSGQSLLGYGRVYTNLVNNGTVTADNPAVGGPATKYLILLDEPKTNNALISSSNGGGVHFRNTTLTQGAAGVVSAGTGSTAGFESSALVGGTLTSVGTGVCNYYATTSLNGVTASGAHQVTDNSTVSIVGDIVNNGTISINSPGAPGNITRITAGAAAVAVSGTGTIRLQGVSGGNGDNLSSHLTYTSAANVLTNGAGHTIAGYGRIYTNLVNNGTITADNPAVGGPATKYLIFLDEPKANNGTISASNGGGVHFRSITLTQGPTGVVSTTGASTAGLENAAIVGGSVSTSAAGPLNCTSGTSALESVTLNPGSLCQVLDNGTLTIGPAGIVNNGTIAVQTIGGAGNLTRLRSAGAATISGTGIVRLQATGLNNNTSYLDGLGSAANPLTLGPGQTLSGAGRLFGNIAIRGTISPDQPFGTPGPISRIDVINATTLSAKASYACELASTSSYDQIGGSGSIAVNGTLNVSLIGGFDPPVGSSYDVISGPAVTGTFTTVNMPTLLNKKQWFVIYGPNYVRLYATCYANCDGSSGSPALTANDFSCFLNKYANNDAYANCDGVGGLTANDFSCFLNRYANGCN
jgi:hypothetical protein